MKRPAARAKDVTHDPVSYTHLDVYKRQDKQSWTGTLPISYWFEGQEPRHGTWMPYVAGPYTPAPWAEEDAKSADQSQEALPSGAFHSTTDSRRLISPLQGG